MDDKNHTMTVSVFHYGELQSIDPSKCYLKVFFS